MKITITYRSCDRHTNWYF